MNLTDLTEMLRDRAELADTAHDARLVGVKAKMRASKRRRAVAGVACVILAVVGVVYTVVPQPGRSSEPATSTRGFPEYKDGTRLVAQAWRDLPASSVTVRFVPRSLDLTLFTRCDIGKSRALWIRVTVNGNPHSSSTCGSGGEIVSGFSDWASVGFVVGQPAEATLTVEGEEDRSVSTTSAPLLAAPVSGTFAIGFGEAVPPSEYPFPPRPETLETISPRSPELTNGLRADPADPSRRREITTRWPGLSMVHAAVNTPGRLRVLVNDVQVIDYSHWSYEARTTQSLTSDYWEKNYGLKLSPGEVVRITVIPERMTGDWVVELT